MEAAFQPEERGSLVGQRAQADVFWTERKLRSLVENSSDVVVLVDPQATILYVSPSVSRVLGLSPGELVGHNSFDVVHPDDRERLTSLLARLLEEPEGIVSAEFRLVHLDGSYRWAEGVARNLLGDAAVNAIVCNFRDITERKRMEAALRESEERFAAFMDHLPGPAWIKDLQGRYVYANQEAARAFSVPVHGLIGRTDADLFPPDAARQFTENDRRVLAEKRSVQTTEVLRQANGCDHYSIVSKFAVPGPGGRVAYVAGVAVDITERRRVEEALRQSEGRLRMLTETLPAVPWSATPEGMIEYFSDKWLEWTGLTREQAMGEGWKEVVHPEDVPRLAAAACHSIRTGEPFSMEHRLRRAQGRSYRWYRSRAQPERDRSGQIVRWHGITDDIHELKTALDAVEESEKQLREREQRLRLALETAALGSYERDLTTNVVRLNANCRQILGLPEGPVDPEAARKSLHPEDRARVLAAAAPAFDPARREICASEFRIVRPDGSVRWLAGRGRVVFDDTVQPPRGLKFLGVLHDVTGRKLAEEALQNQNRRLSLLSKVTARLLLTEEPDQIVAGIAEQLPEWLAVDGILEFAVNESGEELHLKGCWGAGREMLEQGLSKLRLGEGLSGTVAQEHRPIVLERVQQSAHPKVGLTRKLGIKAYACYPLMVGERLFGTIPFASRRRESYQTQDLQFFETLAGHVALAQERRRLSQELRRHTEGLERTVRERTAELQETVEELEHFSYALLHDMRAPLRATMSFATLLETECVASSEPPVRLEYLQRIKASSERLDHLVRDALNYTKVLRREFPIRPVPLLPLLHGLIESYPELWPHQTKIHLAPNLPVVLGNEAVLTECFSNLLRNAIKFVAPGTIPQVRVWAEEVRSAPCVMQSKAGGVCRISQLSGADTAQSTPEAQKPLRFVRIWVEDNGIGIPQEAHESIFAMFRQVHTTEVNPGTGIGLAIVRKGIERIGGRVGVESELGKGSKFWLELQESKLTEAGRPTL